MAESVGLTCVIITAFVSRRPTVFNIVFDFLFEVPQEGVTSLSCKLNILSLPRDILSVSTRLGNKKKKKKKKEIDVLYSQ